MVVWDGITAMRDMATAFEFGDQTALVTLSSAGVVARSVHRSVSTGVGARRERSSGRNASGSVSLARGACVQTERATASRNRYARPFPLLTEPIKDADRRILNGACGIESNSYPSDRASDGPICGRRESASPRRRSHRG